MIFRPFKAAALLAVAFFVAAPALAGPDYTPSRKATYPSPNMLAPDTDRLTIRGAGITCAPGATCDVSGLKAAATGSSTMRSFSDWLADTPNINTFAGGPPTNGDWTANVLAAEASNARQIFLPDGEYAANLDHFQVVNKTYVGPGRLVLNGVKQAPYRSFTLNPVPDISDDRLQVFSAYDWTKKAPGAAAYAYVGSGATGTPITSYKNFPQLGMSFRVFDNAAGFNVDPADHAKGRSGMFVDTLRVYQGGQGDLNARSTFASVYVSKPGLTHFLAGPQVGVENGNIGAESGARGAYLQKQEYIMSDKAGTSVAAINSVMNYHRNTDADGLSQVWGHDRVQAAGPVPIDFAYSLAGPIRRGIDMTPADFGAEQGALVLRAGQRQYWNAGATLDPLGISFISKDLRNTYTYYDGTSGALTDVVGGVGTFLRYSNLTISTVPQVTGIVNSAPVLPNNSWSVYYKDANTAVLTMKLADGVQRYGTIPMSTTPP